MWLSLILFWCIYHLTLCEIMLFLGKSSSSHRTGGCQNRQDGAYGIAVHTSLYMCLVCVPQDLHHDVKSVTLPVLNFCGCLCLTYKQTVLKLTAIDKERDNGGEVVTFSYRSRIYIPSENVLAIIPHKGLQQYPMRKT